MQLDDHAWQQALDVIPFPEKQHYLMAQSTVPELVHAESHPDRFLVCCNNDYHTAVCKIVKYWKVRYELFEDRAFLPLVLDPQETDFLTLNLLRLLSIPDNQGRTILMSDSSKTLEYWNTNLQPRLRASFILFNVAMQNPVSQTKGLTSLVLYGGGSYTFHPVVSKILVEWIESVFAISSLRTFLVAIEDRLIVRFTLRTILQLVLLEHCFNMIRSMRVFVCANVEQAQIELISTGCFSQRNLPPELSGNDGNTGCDTKAVKASSTVLSSRTNYSVNPENSNLYIFRCRYPRIYNELLQMPQDDVNALINAVQCNPYFVQKESNPGTYIVFCNGDRKIAAQKIAAYWKLRCSIFAECAFLPLLLPSSNILHSTEIAPISAGHFELLPNNRHGRPVVFYDICKTKINQRMLFYMLQSITRNQQATAVVLIKDFLLDDLPIFKMFANFVALAFPFDVEYIMLCHTTETNFSQAASVSLSGCAEFIFCSNSEDFCQALQTRGFYSRFLPISIGGVYSGADSNSMNASNDKIPKSKNPEFVKKQHLRLKARRTRERKKERFKMLKEEVTSYNEKNVYLKQQNAQLEKLLFRAKEQATNADRGMNNVAKLDLANTYSSNTSYLSHTQQQKKIKAEQCSKPSKPKQRKPKRASIASSHISDSSTARLTYAPAHGQLDLDSDEEKYLVSLSKDL